MNVTYDASVDAAYIQIASSRGGVETILVDDHVAVDIDSERRVVGVEILDASSRLDLEDLKSFDFEVYGEQSVYDRHRDAATVRDRRATTTRHGADDAKLSWQGHSMYAGRGVDSRPRLRGDRLCAGITMALRRPHKGMKMGAGFSVAT